MSNQAAWISVDDQLPELHQDVLWVASEMTGHCEFYSRRIFAGRYQGNDQGVAEFSIPGLQLFGTHWMPLPDPPEVK